MQYKLHRAELFWSIIRFIFKTITKVKCVIYVPLVTPDKIANIFLFVYLFSHLTDAFIQSDLQMIIEAIKTNKRATTCK